MNEDVRKQVLADLLEERSYKLAIAKAFEPDVQRLNHVIEPMAELLGLGPESLPSPSFEVLSVTVSLRRDGSEGDYTVEYPVSPKRAADTGHRTTGRGGERLIRIAGTSSPSPEELAVTHSATHAVGTGSDEDGANLVDAILQFFHARPGEGFSVSKLREDLATEPRWQNVTGEQVRQSLHMARLIDSRLSNVTRKTWRFSPSGDEASS